MLQFPYKSFTMSSFHNLSLSLMDSQIVVSIFASKSSLVFFLLLFFFWLQVLFALFCRNSCEYFSFLKYVKSHTKMFSGSLNSSVMIAICTSKSLQASFSLLHVRTLTYLESTWFLMILSHYNFIYRESIFQDIKNS